MFVDDLRENCEGAEAVGMTAVLHRGADTTLPELERLLGVELVWLKLVLWDIDGTLVSTAGHGRDAFGDAFERVFGRAPRRTG